MLISLDYDETYTRDPELWDNFITLLKQRGHTVYCVTMRFEEYEGDIVKKNLLGKVDGIYFTARKAKQPFMFNLGICIDVWIDDMPGFVVGNAGEWV